MGKYLGIFGLLLAFTLSVYPQKEKKLKAVDKPNLSGLWMLDRKKSNIGPGPYTDLPLEISHHDPEFRVVRRFQWNGEMKVQDSIYYSDKRGETNPTTMFMGADTPGSNMRALEQQKTSSTTGWKDDQLVVRSLVRSQLRGRMLEFEVIDEWKLSRDKNTLTQTTRRIAVNGPSNSVFIPATQSDSKRVYQRIPD